jgi:CspA family cold shock protein
MARGVVRFFRAEKGWGPIASTELPPGEDASVRFSMIDGPGYRSLAEGDVVEFD